MFDIRRDRRLFVFYDTETSGTNTVFDQVLQFAAILTNDQLEEVDRFEIRCRCLPWIIPAPMALKVTGVTPDRLDDPGLPSFYDMMSAIRKKLENWGPAIYAGYNSMRFDEPLLQRAFWQALHPPYLTVTNGNARRDILPLVQAASHLYEGAFNYPITPRGRTGFKLDKLAPLNGFAHENAHDALADVEATIFIARILAEKCSELWTSNVASARKSDMASRLLPGEPFLFVEYFISGPSVWWGQRVDQQGALAGAASCLRLDANWNEIFILDDEALAKRLTASPKPLRDIALNKAPIVLDQTAARSMGYIPEADIFSQSEFLTSNEVACAKLLQNSEALGEPWPKAEHLEQQIFEGFPSREDSARMEDFHRSDWPGKAALIRSFEDERLQQLAQRIVYASAPEVLSEADRTRMAEAIAGRLHDDHADPDLWRTVPQAIGELSEVRSFEGGEATAAEIEEWLKAKSEAYPPVQPGS
ncbi:MAG: exonuclease domain-containing protein [Hyphomonas sp.]